jgi:hypothetical protein
LKILLFGLEDAGAVAGEGLDIIGSQPGSGRMRSAIGRQRGGIGEEVECKTRTLTSGDGSMKRLLPERELLVLPLVEES